MARFSLRPRSTSMILVLAALVTVVATVGVIRTVDVDALTTGFDAMTGDPVGLTVALGAFGAAFVLRAALWTRLLPTLRFGDALSAVHVALGANHVLPFRLGEGLRVLVARARSDLPLGILTSSTVALRLADVATLVAVGVIVAPGATFDLVGWWGVVAGTTAGVGALAAAVVLGRQARDRGVALRRDPLVVLGAAAAWVLEAVLVHRIAVWTGLEPSWSAAVFVATVSVAAQLVAIAPGGFGTYEAAATAAWVTTGADAETALAAALATHAVKTLWSIGVGIMGVMFPRPSLIGPLRLPVAATSPRRADPATDGPIVLFFPALDEEATVADVVGRVPDVVSGRPVVSVVVDDGSTDRTAELAAAAGAVVIHHGENRGLGAAVRTGLRDGVERGAAVVVFADADGEYPPEQLARLVDPILDGDADFVHGSRFLGGDRSMRPHRWLGNRVLTLMTAWIARTPMTDAQTGYRAYSRSTAAEAEVIHDYNYAQVLTLDLLAKGRRLTEVSIDYAFRTEGRSFVRLPTYLRRVVPAVLREVRTAADTPSPTTEGRRGTSQPMA
ncbi:MAG: lysylphosphatidylglycerol synthase domain-containing protein [Actinomycetota bacterium]